MRARLFARSALATLLVLLVGSQSLPSAQGPVAGRLRLVTEQEKSVARAGMALDTTADAKSQHEAPPLCSR